MISYVRRRSVGVRVEVAISGRRWMVVREGGRRMGGLHTSSILGSGPRSKGVRDATFAAVAASRAVDGVVVLLGRGPMVLFLGEARVDIFVVGF